MMSLKLLPLLRDIRLLANCYPSYNHVASFSTMVSSNSNYADGELSYLKMGKLADYHVPEKVKEIALNPDSPSKFLDRIRLVDKSFSLMMMKF